MISNNKRVVIKQQQSGAA